MSRIVYIVNPPTEIAGGIKIAFRHIEALRAAGFDAVVCTLGAIRPTWFETTAPIINAGHALPADDILVLSEDNYGLLKRYASVPNRKLVLCQSQYQVSKGLGGPEGRRNYAGYGVSGIICTSNSIIDYCQVRFPSMPLALVPVGIDNSIFGDQREKKLQIAFIPRKRQLEAAFMWDLFSANPDFAGIPWIVLRGATEKKVADTLRDSALCLSLSRFESLGMTILEGMACGCVVAGFTGFGAREFTTTRNGFWADEDDCMQCVEQLARATRMVQANGPSYQNMVREGLKTASPYSYERMDQDVVAFWTGYFAGTAFPKPVGPFGPHGPY